jgi:RNA recognition motif-containing protein
VYAAIIIKMAAYCLRTLSASENIEEKMEVKLYCGNMSYGTTEDELRTLFAEAGTVVTVDVIKDRSTGDSKGFAFITMASQADATKAISLLNGKDVNGRALTVNTAKAREERPGGFRPGGGPNRHGHSGSNNRY